MAKVPYSPVPEVAPNRQIAPAPNINAPAEAFGSEQAKGLSGFGNALARAGDEIFNRAIAIQQVNNDTEAREAATEYMIAAGDLHAAYNALQGRDRVLAYPKYAEDLKSTRQKIAEKLSNPDARRRYDSASMGTMSHSIFNGAGAAASANKQWTIGVAESELALDIKSVEDSPRDDIFFAQKLSRIESTAKNLAAQKGFGADSPLEAKLVLEARSKAWAQRLTGMSREEPFRAAELLEANKTQLTSDDFLRVDNLVRAQGRAVGGSQIVDQVYSPDKTLEQMETEVKLKAKELNPKDPLLDDVAITALRTRYNQQRHAKRVETLEANETVNGIIMDRFPTTLQEFLSDKQAMEAYERLPKKDQISIPGRINRYQDAVTRRDNEANYTRLSGMANSDDPEAREAFLNIDPTSEKLSQAQMRQVMQMQRKLKENINGDPRVTKAVTWLRGAMGAQLEALGVFRRTDSNKEDYDAYVGTLQSALDVWQEQNKKPATYKDVVETIGPQIVRQRTEPYLYFFKQQVPFFRQTVPPEFAEASRRIANDPNMPEEQIYKLWTRMQYKELYAKPGPKDGSRVPGKP